MIAFLPRSFEGVFRPRTPRSREQIFCDRYSHLWPYIDDCYEEGFWVELSDVIQQPHEERYITCGAVVKELPSTREITVQANPQVTEVGFQTEPFRECSRSPPQRRDNGGTTAGGELVSTLSILICSPPASEIG